MSDTPKCPWCKTAKHVYEDGDRNFRCLQCNRLFDDDPDEGGNYSNNPTRGTQSKEEFEIRQTRRREARRNRR